MGHHHQRASQTDPHSNTAISDDRRAKLPGSLVQLQRTIGNQAMRRVLVQRAPNAAPVNTRKPAEHEDTGDRTLYLATIIGEHQGEFRGHSRVAGHEGQIELEDFRLDPALMDMHLMMQVNDTIPFFHHAAEIGEKLTAQFFTLRRRRGKIEVLQTLELKDGYISNLSVSGSDKDALASATIQFKRPAK